MASPQSWQNHLELNTERPAYNSIAAEQLIRRDSSTRFWIAADLATVIFVAAAVLTYEMNRAGTHLSTMMSFHFLCAVALLVCLFPAMLIFSSKRFHLYESGRIKSILHELSLSLEACVLSGLALGGLLYLGDFREIVPRPTIFLTIGFAAGALVTRRLAFRAALQYRHERGVDLRNVFVVGTGPEAQSLRVLFDNGGCPGYSFRGFIAPHYGPGLPKGPQSVHTSSSAPASEGETIGTLDTLFDEARRHFVDEIILATRCAPEIIGNLLQQARDRQIDLRVVPELSGGFGWDSPIEFLGQLPTIPLHRGSVQEFELFFKRAFDIAFSTAVLLLLAPLLALIALAIKLDSPGPVFYLSERVGKKGFIFRCVKFRTMSVDADKRRAELMHMNEREGVLFKLTNDPRVTRLGRFLRKYSFDELPQFWNVLAGDMSVVGPRPPLATEVKSYKLSHLRRLDVKPGITGLWQVQGRQDPSFESYISLDVTYIENWSLWLDFKIIFRTVQVVIAGTGT